MATSREKNIKRINPPLLTDAEIKEIDAYWAQYGIKLDDYRWHQMYYHATGMRDPKFIPHNLADSVLYPYYNDREKSKIWTDKNYFERFLSTLTFPRALAQDQRKVL